MSNLAGGKRRYILIALLAALAGGGVLYYLSQLGTERTQTTTTLPPPGKTEQTTQAQAFWAHDLRHRFGISTLDLALTPDGATLSHFHALTDSLRFYSIAAGPGTLYSVGDSWHLTAYDVASGRSTDLQPLLGDRMAYEHSLTVAPNGKLYGIARERGDDPTVMPYLFEYDPAAGSLQFLDQVGTMANLVAGHDGRIYGFVSAARAQFVYDPATRTLQELDHVAAPARDGSQGPLLAGDDGLLYGWLAQRQNGANLFAFDPASGAVLTHTPSLPPERYFAALAPRPGGGAYAVAGGELWFFDPRQRSATKLFERHSAGFDSLVALQDGRLLGAGIDYTTLRHQGHEFLFSFDPASGQFEELEALYGRPLRMLVGPDHRVYAGDYVRTWSVDPDAFVSQGSIVSEAIKPVALVLTRTVVGDWGIAARALACLPGKPLYGVTSRVRAYYDVYRPEDSPPVEWGRYDVQWLFAYDPQASDVGITAVMPAETDAAIGGTALAALDDGRLIAATQDGRLLAYDPASGTTRDFGKAPGNTWQIAVLAASHDGLVYAGTVSYERATLISLDPNSGVMTDLGASLPQAHLVGALAVAPDGRVFAGVGNALVVYDPVAHATSTLGTIGAPGECAIRALVADQEGRIYGGCGIRLFRYGPGDSQPGELEQLAPLPRPSAPIGAMVIGADGRLYGSNGQLFAYDPRDGQTQFLGATVPGLLIALAACPDGAIYAGSGMSDSYHAGPAYLFAFSPQCTAGLLGHWGRVTWDADTPAETSIRVEVLDARTRETLAHVNNGDSLEAIDPAEHPEIMLQATLFTQDPQATPALRHWRVDYSFECRHP